MTVTRILVAAMTVGLAISTAAEQPQPLTYVALFRVEPPNVEKFLALGKQYVPTLDKLFTDGTLMAYGIDSDLMHRPNQLNVAFWYTVSSYTNLQKAEEAIEAFQAKSPQLMKETAALTDLSKHRDILARSLDRNWSKTGSCKPTVTSFSRVQVKPGKRDDFMADGRKYQKPVMDQLVNDGAMCSYSVDVEDVHTVDPGTVWVIMSFPNLGSMDKLDQAFDAANAKLSASERTARTQARREIVDMSKHEDSLARNIVFRSK